MRVALEIQHGVYDVLQHPRPGEGAFLGHMADQNHANPRLLGHPGELGGAFAHLGHRARRRLEGLRIHGLDRVDHRHPGLFPVQGGEDFFQADFGEQLHLPGINLEAAGAQRDLLAGLLAGHIQHRMAGGRQAGQGLEQQGALADARIAADQHHPALDQAAAQHAVEFVNAGGLTRLFARIDFGQTLQFARGGERGVAIGGRPGDLGNALHQGLPLTAAGALPHPLGRGGAAFGAGINRLRLGHQTSTTGTRPARAQNSS